MSEQRDEGFKVTDRRRFDPSGNPKEGAPHQAGAEEAPQEHRGEGFTARPAPSENPLPEMGFSTFVLSLHASTLVHLGLVMDPDTGEPIAPNFELAQQTIEILSMLEQKTRGNLTPEELQLLEGVLYELRLQYVERRKPRARAG